MSDNISTLIGILLDVSGSMSENVGEGVHVEGGAWVRSIFKVIDDLIKHDVLSSNCVFAVGFGASCGNGIFDLLSTLEQFQNRNFSGHHFAGMSYEDTIERILEILETSGASTVRKWAPKSVIRNSVPSDMASLILRVLECDHDFVRSFVNDCLPPACRDFGCDSRSVDRRQKVQLCAFATCCIGVLALPFSYGISGLLLSSAGAISAANFAYGVYASGVSKFRTATEGEVIEVVEKAKGMMLKDVSEGSSIFNVKTASDIIHGYVDEEELTESRIHELMDTVVPFIYGRTPLFKSLQKAAELFSNSTYRSHKKLLFLLSDGMPTDDGNKDQLISELRNADVTVVSCFITKSTHVEPHRLYSSPRQHWEDGAKFLFDLSSTITTQLLPRTIFVKRGWKIDIQNNETRLFLHVNHPDIMKDACNLARDVISSQDALTDILVSVSLDIYINQSTSDFPAQTQVGGTCYANASAAVLHLSMKRILGREGGYPDFKELRKTLIDLYGENGANTLGVLQAICPEYRLRCQEVDVAGAVRAVIAKRPVVARFRLTDSEWDKFTEFYRNNPTGILTKREIDIRRRHAGEVTHGHAVVLTSFNSECLRLMNSWGTGWGDIGFFRVKTADVIGLEFVDVFWTLDDLTNDEKIYHDRHGAEVAATLINRLTGLQVAEYQCPLCNQTSLVTEFTGQLLLAKCPKCEGEFRSDEAGNILALNMYLTSLSRYDIEK